MPGRRAGWCCAAAAARARARSASRYPLVELLTAAVFGVLGWRFGASWELPAYLYLGAVGVALARDRPRHAQAAEQHRAAVVRGRSGPPGAGVAAGARRGRRGACGGRRRPPCTPSTSCWPGHLAPWHGFRRREAVRRGRDVPGMAELGSPGRRRVRRLPHRRPDRHRADAGRPGRPQDARSRTARSCSSGRSSGCCGAPQIADGTRASSVADRDFARTLRPDRSRRARRQPILPAETPLRGKWCGRQVPPCERLASWQDDPPSVSTSGRRGCAQPSSRSARPQVTLEKFGQVALPEGPCATARWIDPAAVAEAIKQLWTHTKFSGKKVVIGVANQKVIVRQVDLPWLPDERAELVARRSRSRTCCRCRSSTPCWTSSPSRSSPTTTAAGCCAACWWQPPARWC